VSNQNLKYFLLVFFPLLNVAHYRTDEKTLSFDPVEFLARLSVHVPNAHEQTVRYMGPVSSNE
jgi:hypothetical protein